MLVSRQPATALGIERLTVGGLVLVLLLLIITPAFRVLSQPRSWRVTRIIGVAAATAPMALRGHRP